MTTGVERSKTSQSLAGTRFELAIAILALVISFVSAGLTAGFSYWQVYEAGRMSRWSVWSNFLAQYDSDDMWQSKATLRRYLKDLRRMPGAPQDKHGFQDFATGHAERFIGHYVYYKNRVTDDSDYEFLGKDEASKERYFSELDRCRRRVKTFFEQVALFTENDLVDESSLGQRWGRETVEFLRNVWLPIEKGQNNTADDQQEADDENAQSDAMVDWFAKRLLAPR
jgi:hypothetical protein